MRGITATINVQSFRSDWMSHMPIAGLCVRYTITKDQVIRLRDIWRMPLRNDRRLRFKPTAEQTRDPSPDEISRACKEIQSKWDDHTREERAAFKTPSVQVKTLWMTDEANEALGELGDE